jgi:hypothetical protein
LPAESEANCAHHRPVRLSWARLLKQVLDLDLEHRPNCGGELKVVAAIPEQESRPQRKTGQSTPNRSWRCMGNIGKAGAGRESGGFF